MEVAFPGQLPAWHKLMERSLWRAATAGARLARARIQDWASSQQGECPGVKAALLGYAAVASACPVPLGRASAMVQGHPKIQVSMAGTTSRLSLCHQVAAPVQGSVIVPGLARPDLPPCPGAGHSPAAACDLWPGGSLGCVGTHGAEVWYLAVTGCVQRCGLCSCSMAQS